MRRGLIREVLGSLIRLPQPVTSFYREVMRRKQDDHHASHSNTVNQLFHIVSSSVFIGCYALAFWDLTTAMWAGLGALFLRQIGHAILEPPCHDKEATLLGFNTRNKTPDPRRVPVDPRLAPRAGRAVDRRGAAPASRPPSPSSGCCGRWRLSAVGSPTWCGHTGPGWRWYGSSS